MEKPYWEGKEYSYFSHKKCEFFPCHKNADPDDFNCLFCYCPLYALGEKCGGNFRYTEKGIKDCTNCMLPHKRKNYGYVTGKYQELADMMKRAGCATTIQEVNVSDEMCRLGIKYSPYMRHRITLLRIINMLGIKD